MVADVAVHPRAFARDVGSYALVLLVTALVALQGYASHDFEPIFSDCVYVNRSVGLFTALFFVFLYMAYVGVVMIMDQLAKVKKKKRGQPVHSCARNRQSQSHLHHLCRSVISRPSGMCHLMRWWPAKSGEEQLQKTVKLKCQKTSCPAMRQKRSVQLTVAST